MNPIELFIIAGRIAGVVVALAAVGWFTNRRARTNPERTS
jgi:hypothetical protein